jgi:hypothetical protein
MYKFLYHIFSKFNKKLMKDIKRVAKTCNVFYNKNDILVIAVHGTPIGFNPYGNPAKTVSRNISPELLGNLVINTMNESAILYDENCVDNGNKFLYKHAGVRSWRELGKKWKLIGISKMLDSSKVTMVVYKSVKNGSYLATTNEPTYYIDLIPTEIGSTLFSIMDNG